jgi:hypothetical protein
MTTDLAGYGGDVCARPSARSRTVFNRAGDGRRGDRREGGRKPSTSEHDQFVYQRGWCLRTWRRCVRCRPAVPFGMGGGHQASFIADEELLHSRENADRIRG